MINYVGAPEGSIIDENFKEENFLKLLDVYSKDGQVCGNYEFLNDINVIETNLYEGGIHFKICVIIDLAANHYETFTLADVIVSDAGVSFVITVLDGRLEQNAKVGKTINNLYTEVNTDIKNKLIRSLGKKLEFQETINVSSNPILGVFDSRKNAKIEEQNALVEETMENVLLDKISTLYTAVNNQDSNMKL